MGLLEDYVAVAKERGFTHANQVSKWYESSGARPSGSPSKQARQSYTSGGAPSRSTPSIQPTQSSSPGASSSSGSNFDFLTSLKNYGKNVLDFAMGQSDAGLMGTLATMVVPGTALGYGLYKSVAGEEEVPGSEYTESEKRGRQAYRSDDEDETGSSLATSADLNSFSF